MNVFDHLNIDLTYTLPIQYSKVYIADISGIDSIAALVSILNTNDDSVIIPTFVNVACEYGEKDKEFKRIFNELTTSFNTRTIKILPGIVMDVNDFWRRIVSTDIQGTIREVGFYSPCISCHLIFHLARIRLAQHLHLQNVISGEREFHGYKEKKINQIGFVLDYFNAIYVGAGINHFQPVRNVREKQEINDYVNPYNIKPLHLNCLFSGNYYKPGTSDIDVDRQSVNKYLESCLSIAIKSINESFTISCTVIDS